MAAIIMKSQEQEEKEKAKYAATFYCASYEKSRECSLGQWPNRQPPAESLMQTVEHNAKHFQLESKRNAQRFKCNNCEYTCFWMYQAVSHKCKQGKADMRSLEINMENANDEVDFYRYMNAHFVIANINRPRFSLPEIPKDPSEKNATTTTSGAHNQQSQAQVQQPAVYRSVSPHPLFGTLSVTHGSAVLSSASLVEVAPSSVTALPHGLKPATTTEESVGGRGDRSSNRRRSSTSESSTDNSPISRNRRARSRSHDSRSRRRAADERKKELDQFEELQQKRAIANYNPRELARAARDSGLSPRRDSLPPSRGARPPPTRSDSSQRFTYTRKRIYSDEEDTNSNNRSVASYLEGRHQKKNRVDEKENRSSDERSKTIRSRLNNYYNNRRNSEEKEKRHNTGYSRYAQSNLSYGQRNRGGMLVWKGRGGGYSANGWQQRWGGYERSKDKEGEGERDKDEDSLDRRRSTAGAGRKIDYTSRNEDVRSGNDKQDDNDGNDFLEIKVKRERGQEQEQERSRSYSHSHSN